MLTAAAPSVARGGGKSALEMAADFSPSTEAVGAMLEAADWEELDREQWKGALVRTAVGLRSTELARYLCCNCCTFVLDS